MDSLIATRRPPRAVALVAALVLPALGACSGSIGDGAGSSQPMTPSTGPGPTSPTGPGPVGPGPTGPGPAGPGPTGPSASACAVTDPGPSPLRRLTRVEYDNTVRALLGTTNNLAAELFPPDEEQFGFDNSAEGRGLNSGLALGYWNAAERHAKDAVSRLNSLLPCAGRGDDACFEEFLNGFATRAYRRPLDDEEKASLRKVFATGKSGGTFAQGIETVLQVMLLSPQFLYRDERGVDVPGKPYQQLTSWELASRLSYLLWGSMPDDELFTAAREGKLSTREQVIAQARRMVNDPRALAMMTNFYGQWLQLGHLAAVDKEVEKFPTWKENTAKLMRQETENLVQHVLKNENKFSALLTAPYTFVNQELAAFYGFAGVTGPDFRKVDVDAKRAGILTQGGFLSSHATPAPGLTALIFRGVFVREQLLCQPLPEPPDDAADRSPPVTPTTTARSWSQERMAISECGGCHAAIDPIGYGFEGFDEIGMPKTGAFDASGSVSGSDVAGPFNGAIELAQKLSKSKDAQACLATQWYRFANGRKEDGMRDQCSLNTLRGAFEASGGDLKELLVHLTQTDAFLLRSKGDAQ